MIFYGYYLLSLTDNSVYFHYLLKKKKCISTFFTYSMKYLDLMRNLKDRSEKVCHPCYIVYIIMYSQYKQNKQL